MFHGAFNKRQGSTNTCNLLKIFFSRVIRKHAVNSGILWLVYIVVQILLALPVGTATMEGEVGVPNKNNEEKVQKLIVKSKFGTSGENCCEDSDLRRLTLTKSLTFSIKRAAK